MEEEVDLGVMDLVEDSGVMDLVEDSVVTEDSVAVKAVKKEGLVDSGAVGSSIRFRQRKSTAVNLTVAQVHMPKHRLT